MIELTGINKVYHIADLDVPVLKDIHLKIENGEYVSIMGPSGSGKSTLMNIIGCLDLPSSGNYLLNNLHIMKEEQSTLAHIRNKYIGFVFQQFHLLPRLTAIQNVELPLIYAGVRKKERKERALEALKKVNLEDRIHHLPNQLSGGQKQRVAIARALVNNPTFILADEPTGALDSKSGTQVMELFTKLNKEGTTVIVVTHEEEVAAYTNRKIYIRDGQIVEDRSVSHEYH